MRACMVWMLILAPLATHCGQGASVATDARSEGVAAEETSSPDAVSQDAHLPDVSEQDLDVTIGDLAFDESVTDVLDADKSPKVEDEGLVPGPDALPVDGAQETCSTACTVEDKCFASACGDGCVFSPVWSDACFVAPAVLAEDFEGPTLPIGWTVDEDQDVTFRLTETRAHSGHKSLKVDGVDPGSWSTAGRVTAVLASPPVTPKPGAPIYLRFWVWADVEDGDLWDVLTVTVETEQGKVPTWSKGYGFPMFQWTEVMVDLSAFAGSTFRVLIGFDTVDDTFNDGEGLYLDDVFLLRGGSPLQCTNAADCDDHIPCTVESCSSGACTYELGTSCCTTHMQCDDHDVCTFDVCKSGGCEHVPVGDPLCCNTAVDCDDHNECTVDACVKNRCSNDFKAGAGCCKTASDCDDKDKCTKDMCVDFHCTYQNVCCKSAIECDDHDDICTKDDCVDGKCVHLPTGAPGCCVPELARWSFDAGDGGWEFSELQDGVGWQVTIADGAETVSPPGALYYGSVETWDFDNGDKNSGVAKSPYVHIPAGFEAHLTMQLWLDVEEMSGWDKLKVFIDSDVGEVAVFEKTWDTPIAKWFEVKADLSAWAGKDVSIRLVFDTVDDSGNDGKGVFVDDVSLTTTCMARPCGADKDCSDGIWKSVEHCVAGYCEYTF